MIDKLKKFYTFLENSWKKSDNQISWYFEDLLSKKNSWEMFSK